MHNLRGNKSDLKILFSSFSIKPISLAIESFKKISNLAKTKIFIIYKKQSDGRSSDLGKRSKFSSEEDSFFVFEKRERPKYILDSNDLTLDFQKKKYFEQNGDLPNNEINLNYIENDEHEYITQNYYFLIFYWKILHFILLIFNFILVYHLVNLIQNKIIKFFHIYSISIYLIIGFTFVNNAISIYYLILNKPINACCEYVNFLLIFSFIIIFGCLSMNHLILKKKFYLYLIGKTKYQKIFESMLIIVLITLLLTFKMKEFYQYYQDNLPIKYSLLPDKEEAEKLKINFERRNKIKFESEELDNYN
jgi:hypothetical protein